MISTNFHSFSLPSLFLLLKQGDCRVKNLFSFPLSNFHSSLQLIITSMKLARFASTLKRSFPMATRYSRTLPSNTIIKFVPQQEAWIVERFGKFNRILDPGLSFLIPLVEKVTYVKTLKEVAVEIPSQSAITQDNVTISLDGVLYYRIVDPYRASYGVEDADFSIAQLAQTTMRSEIGN